MSDVKRLLAEATPLPWVVQEPGDKDPGAGTVFIDTHAYEDGPEPVVAETYPLGRADAALIVHAVNHLPAYEAAVDALERLCDYTDAAADCPYPAHDACDHRKWLRDETDLARAALRRLRDEVPA